MCCGTIGSCQSAATSEIVRNCKALLVTSLTHVSGAIASVQTLYLYVSEELFNIVFSRRGMFELLQNTRLCVDIMCTSHAVSWMQLLRSYRFELAQSHTVMSQLLNLLSLKQNGLR